MCCETTRPAGNGKNEKKANPTLASKDKKQQDKETEDNFKELPVVGMDGKNDDDEDIKDGTPDPSPEKVDPEETKRLEEEAAEQEKQRLAEEAAAAAAIIAAKEA